MDKRIKDLIRQAGGHTMVAFADETNPSPTQIVSVDFDPPETLEKFVELIIKECSAYLKDTDYNDVVAGANTALEMAADDLLEYFGIE
jgi:hypothetical protein